ncbi:hypothetical protein [Microbispora sp. NPDC049633]|uniref:hypothetical protein n=1 Tax=Microbispora sp. NPDC049633 TaxID=3154355 RepID=UPI003436A0B9
MRDGVVDRQCDDLHRAAEAHDPPGFLATLQELREGTADWSAAATTLLQRPAAISMMRPSITLDRVRSEEGTRMWSSRLVPVP